jgi:hypothetical protein
VRLVATSGSAEAQLTVPITAAAETGTAIAIIGQRRPLLATPRSLLRSFLR